MIIGPSIPTDGLIFLLDPTNPNCYTSGSNSLTTIYGDNTGVTSSWWGNYGGSPTVQTTCSLLNGATVITKPNGTQVFSLDGTNDGIVTPQFELNLQSPTTGSFLEGTGHGVTLIMFVKFTTSVTSSTGIIAGAGTSNGFNGAFVDNVTGQLHSDYFGRRLNGGTLMLDRLGYGIYQQANFYASGQFLEGGHDAGWQMVAYSQFASSATMTGQIRFISHRVNIDESNWASSTYFSDSNSQATAGQSFYLAGLGFGQVPSSGGNYHLACEIGPVLLYNRLLQSPITAYQFWDSGRYGGVHIDELKRIWQAYKHRFT